MLSYFIEVSIIWALFYIVYLLLLRNSTFFQFNRAFLLVAIIAGLSLPYLEFDNSAIIMPEVFLPLMELDAPVAIAPESSPTINWLIIILSLGASISIVRLLIGFVSIYRLKKGASIVKLPKYTIVRTNKDHAPFSFMHLLFYSKKMQLEDIQKTQVLKHEIAHIHQRHSVDILLIELINLLFWWNPILLGFKKELRDAHEFAADAAVLREYPVSDYGRLILQQTIPNLQIDLINNFYPSQLKSRIIMMTKKASPKRVLFRYTLIAPLLAACLLIFSCEDQKNELKPEEFKGIVKNTSGEASIDPDKVYNVVDEMPLMSNICVSESDPRTCSNKLLLSHIYENLEFPKETNNAGLDGLVIVSFVISKTGEVKDPKVIRSLDKYADAAALDAVNSLPNWIPGRQNGEAVAVKFNLPIRFKLK